MSSSKPPRMDITETARDRGARAYRRHYGRQAKRSSARMRADAGRMVLGLADAGSERASDAADIVTDLGVLMLRTAVAVADDLIGAAGELESRLTGVSGDRRSGEPPESTGPVVSGPSRLKLPDASPGGTAKADFVVRNDSLETVDALRLRCDGLFAPGGLRISGNNVKFTPSLVDVAAHTTKGVTCAVRVARSTKRGRYTGLIAATNWPDVELLVTLNVV